MCMSVVNNYRIFSRTAIPKNPDSACLGIVLSQAGVFRAGLLMTALHYSWLSPNGSLANTDMEETYLYHKLEAMRLINEQIADPELCTTDECIGLIAALAMAESGMGDIAAAEAHLKGLFTLIDMRRPEDWQHRFRGILQRVILVTGSFIAAAKKPEEGGYEQFMTAIGDSDRDTASPQNPHHTRPTGPVFSTAPFIATRLSPFYMGSTPCLEACKADAEGEVLINALRRLSSLTGVDDSAFAGASGPYGRTTLPRLSASRRRGPAPQPLSEAEGGPCEIVRDVTAVLLADTDSYICSLLFKPQPLYPEAAHHESGAQVEGLSSSSSVPQQLSSAWATLPTTTTPAYLGPEIKQENIEYPYGRLPAELFPSSSRAWATAAYLYLHVVLEPLWIHRGLTEPSKKTIDSLHLLRLLLDTLRADVSHTEEAMKIGAYSKELWLWKVMVGAYTLSSTVVKEAGDVFVGDTLSAVERRTGNVPPPITSGISGSKTSNSRKGVVTGSIPRRKRQGKATAVAATGPPFSSSGSGGLNWSSNGSCSDSNSGSSPGVEMENDDGDVDESSEEDGDEEDEGRNQVVDEGNYVASMKAWLAARMRSWGRATRVTNWQGAKQALGKIAWPEHLFEAEVIAEELWRKAMAGAAIVIVVGGGSGSGSDNGR
ncbi:hypothetical protein B0H66DRAFT_184537 [Apodospora peruviana]|uniref:Uncharacterized protein n=1 Tax=Apodospora peruviana TaxID=516989 RepID=A0AAE0M755_9PEZI|nr:hypothetical protein B0H66DRAFT_184537 [Apodospora peruviana]